MMLSPKLVCHPGTGYHSGMRSLGPRKALLLFHHDSTRHGTLRIFEEDGITTEVTLPRSDALAGYSLIHPLDGSNTSPIVIAATHRESSRVLFWQLHPSTLAPQRRACIDIPGIPRFFHRHGDHTLWSVEWGHLARASMEPCDSISLDFDSTSGELLSIAPAGSHYTQTPVFLLDERWMLAFSNDNHNARSGWQSGSIHWIDLAGEHPTQTQPWSRRNSGVGMSLDGWVLLPGEDDGLYKLRPDAAPELVWESAPNELHSMAADDTWLYLGSGSSVVRLTRATLERDQRFAKVEPFALVATPNGVIAHGSARWTWIDHKGSRLRCAPSTFSSGSARLADGSVVTNAGREGLVVRADGMHHRFELPMSGRFVSATAEHALFVPEPNCDLVNENPYMSRFNTKIGDYYPPLSYAEHAEAEVYEKATRKSQAQLRQAACVLLIDARGEICCELPFYDGEQIAYLLPERDGLQTRGLCLEHGVLLTQRATGDLLFLDVMDL